MWCVVMRVVPCVLYGDQRCNMFGVVMRVMTCGDEDCALCGA